jgi:hypothetical protein
VLEPPEPLGASEPTAPSFLGFDPLLPPQPAVATVKSAIATTALDANLRTCLVMDYPPVR